MNTEHDKRIPSDLRGQGQKTPELLIFMTFVHGNTN